ncbi:hypothetical protein BT63DRAFT_457743 [Microthyrium microscopicum]|uniref:Uncharacterized protein n=1 Tax=Microthyrium microscopicum TaxID=703497 RepID=A0A6A6U6T1_9PEZI|nr:hypothetical protein BT63DRAFT_457743 [Microthyrium microscopicum]
MSLLLETVPAFGDTWIECLGDVSRYRMAIEEDDPRDRQTWSNVAKYWYPKAADRIPDNARARRLHHSLFMIARADALQQAFVYSEVDRCFQARNSLLCLPREGDHRPSILKRPQPKGLPIQFHSTTKHTVIMTKYDTGTAANHMTLAQATELGLHVDSNPNINCRFKLANGKIIESIGQTSTEVSFANGPNQAGRMTCHFNVFKSLAVPVLIGKKFLEATKTLSKYRSRLVDLPRRMLRSLRVCAVGDVENEVVCVINGIEVRASADTGSEIPLMRGDYARSRGIYSPHGVEEIQFADGSIGYTSGTANVTISMEHESGNSSIDLRTTFHIFEDLSMNVLLDEYLVDQLEIFQLKAHRFLAGIERLFESLCPVIWLRSVEKTILDIPDRLSRLAGGLRDRMGFANGNQILPQSNHNIAPEITEMELIHQLNALNQQESTSRAAFQQQISNLPPDMQSMATQAEHTRRANFKMKRNDMIRSVQAIEITLLKRLNMLDQQETASRAASDQSIGNLTAGLQAAARQAEMTRQADYDQKRNDLINSIQVLQLSQSSIPGLIDP